MLSKAELKLLQGLQSKKERKQSGLFLAEGEKIVNEILDHGYPVKQIYALEDWKPQKETDFIKISENDLSRISSLSTPNKVVAVCFQPEPKEFQFKKDWFFILDNVQDPGNLGTIIRIADWFGISDIVCSPTCADVYNPKVIQSTMGSFINVRTHYLNLPLFISEVKNVRIPVYGAVLDGDAAGLNEDLAPGGIVLGNESAGISDEIISLLDKKIYIAPVGVPVADSLNVAITSAIIAAAVKSAR